jgi:hypothetical protein
MDAKLTTILRSTIETLRDEVTENLKIIRSNEKIVRQILNQGLQNQEAEQMNALYEINRNLLNKNKEAINIQLKMINFLNTYRVNVPLNQSFNNNDNQTFSSRGIEEQIIIPPGVSKTDLDAIGVSEITEEDYFNLTIEGKIVYNKNHPYFENDEFYKRLMNYYKTSENYEMCAKILRK